ncbi:MAG: AAA family ATPase [Limisphaerales bacterium]
MIKRIRIRDFKSIRQLDLELDPVTVLIGRSGSGKSNLVQAIRFLRNFLLDPGQAVGSELGWEHIVPVGESRPRPTIEALFLIPGEDLEYEYSIHFGTPGQQQFAGSLSLLAERLSLGGHPLFARTRVDGARWKWEVEPKISPMPQMNDAALLGQLPSLQQVVFANASLSSGIGFYHFASSTLTLSNQPHPGQGVPQQVPGLSDYASNYRETMRAITQDFHRPNIKKSIAASLREVNPSVQSVELDSLTSPQRAIVSHKAGDRVFALSLEQESDGFRRFYAHLLALYQAPSKLTLVFEEPENAIYPGALSILADEFKAAPRDDRGQVILTTHNPVFLDSFDVDNVRVVEMRDGNTVAARVSTEQRDAVREQLLTTGELLTVDRARLDTGPNVQLST